MAKSQREMKLSELTELYQRARIHEKKLKDLLYQKKNMGKITSDLLEAHSNYEKSLQSYSNSRRALLFLYSEDKDSLASQFPELKLTPIQQLVRDQGLEESINETLGWAYKQYGRATPGDLGLKGPGNLNQREWRESQSRAPSSEKEQEEEAWITRQIIEK